MGFFIFIFFAGLGWLPFAAKSLFYSTRFCFLPSFSPHCFPAVSCQNDVNLRFSRLWVSVFLSFSPTSFCSVSNLDFSSEPASFPFDVVTLSLLFPQCLHQGPASCTKLLLAFKPNKFTAHCSYSFLFVSKPLRPNARFHWCCSPSIVKIITWRTIFSFTKIQHCFPMTSA